MVVDHEAGILNSTLTIAVWVINIAIVSALKNAENERQIVPSNYILKKARET